MNNIRGMIQSPKKTCLVEATKLLLQGNYSIPEVKFSNDIEQSVARRELGWGNKKKVDRSGAQRDERDRQGIRK